MQTLPSMSCTEAFKSCCQNYAKFTGRARRSEYWNFVLSVFLIEFVIQFPFLFIFGANIASSIISFIALFFLIPSLAVGARRLHDIGKSGCYLWLILIPIPGVFILLYFFTLDSEERSNGYGPSPKYILPASGPIYQNNYVPPGTPLVNQYPQPNAIPIQVNPIPPEVSGYPQPNPGVPQYYPQQDPGAPQYYPQPNPQIPPPQY